MRFIEQMLRQTWDYVRDRHLDAANLQTTSKKGDSADLVTEADYEVQRRIEQALKEAFPGDAVVAEESGRDTVPDDPKGRCWLLDPIDGTHNFARGLIPCFGVSLAFADRGEVRAAGISLPGLGQTFLAQRGGGATRNAKPIRVSQLADLSESRLEIDFMRRSRRGHTLTAASAVLDAVGQVRAHGACVVGMVNVAAGTAEGFMHIGPHPWDYAAGMLIIREAGGRVTRFDGSDPGLFDDGVGLLCSNGVEHENLRNLINSAMK